MTNAACNIPRDGRGIHVPHNVVVVVGGIARAMLLLCSPSVVIDVRHLVIPLITTSTSMWSSRTTILNDITRRCPPSDVSHRRAPAAAAAAVVVVVVVVVFVRGPGEQDAHREYPAHERCPMEGRNDARWRGAAPSPPPHHRPASHRPSQRPPPRVASSFTTSSSSPPTSSNLTTPQLIVNSPLYYCPHPHHRRCSYI